MNFPALARDPTTCGGPGREYQTFAKLMTVAGMANETHRPASGRHLEIALAFQGPLPINYRTRAIEKARLTLRLEGSGFDKQ